MDDLIAKLEVATMGHAFLDREIRDRLGLPAILIPPDGGDEAYPYTSSVEAALSLLPDRTGGYDDAWTIGCVIGGPLSAKPGARFIAEIGDEPIIGEHKTSAALALCIAALKAREIVENANG